MNREWTVRAQLTISQPAGAQSSSLGASRTEKENFGTPVQECQYPENPITIVYEWTTTADDGATAVKDELRENLGRKDELLQGMFVGVGELRLTLDSWLFKGYNILQKASSDPSKEPRNIVISSCSNILQELGESLKKNQHLLKSTNQVTLCDTCLNNFL